VTPVDRLRTEALIAGRRCAGAVLYDTPESARRWAIACDTLGDLLLDEDPS
jgi:hypothetical protein